MLTAIQGFSSSESNATDTGMNFMFEACVWKHASLPNLYRASRLLKALAHHEFWTDMKIIRHDMWVGLTSHKKSIIFFRMDVFSRCVGILPGNYWGEGGVVTGFPTSIVHSLHIPCWEAINYYVLLNLSIARNSTVNIIYTKPYYRDEFSLSVSPVHMQPYHKSHQCRIRCYSFMHVFPDKPLFLWTYEDDKNLQLEAGSCGY